MKEKKNLVHILHLEDNPDDVELAAMMLKKNQIHAEITNVSDKKSFEKADLSAYDLALVDFNLSDYNGLSAVKWIRKQDGNIPVVLVSGTVGEEMAVDLMHAGANEFVLKTNLKKLPLAIRRALKERDLLEQKTRFQTELVEKNLLLDTIFEGFPDAIFFKNSKRQYIKVNHAFCKLHEVSEAEILGNTDNQFMSEHLAAKSRENDALIFQTRTMSRYEVEMVGSDGQRMLLEVVKSPILSADGVTGIVGEARDITHKQKMLKEAEKARQILNQAEDLTQSGSFEYDADMDVVTCSASLLQMLSLNVGGNKISLEKLVRSLIKEDQDLFRSALRRAIEERIKTLNQLRYNKPGGDIGHFKVLFRPDFRDQEGIKYYGTFVDISADMEMSIANSIHQENERKEIARDLHDNLGQKLNAMSMYINKLSDTQSENKELQIVRNLLHESIDDLSSVMNSISVKHVEEHSLSYAIEQLMQNSGLENIDYDFDLDEDRLSGFIKTQAFRIIQELLNNTVKYSQANHVHLHLSTEGGILNVSFGDDGIGFDLNEKADGHGIKNIYHRVRKSSGLINIQTSPGEGVKADIKLPVN